MHNASIQIYEISNALVSNMASRIVVSSLSMEILFFSMFMVFLVSLNEEFSCRFSLFPPAIAQRYPLHILRISETLNQKGISRFMANVNQSFRWFLHLNRGLAGLVVM
jgi:hypothetical protein